MFQTFRPQVTMDLDHGTRQIIGPGQEIVTTNSNNVLPPLRSVFSNVCWTT